MYRPLSVVGYDWSVVGGKDCGVDGASHAGCGEERDGRWMSSNRSLYWKMMKMQRQRSERAVMEGRNIGERLISGWLNFQDAVAIGL